MPTRNALATARLRYTHTVPKAPYHVTIQVWSHTFDHPDASSRSALVTGVYLTQLADAKSYPVSNLSVTDQYGVDHTALWPGTGGYHEVGFKSGYTEYDTAGACGPNLPSIFWGAHTGIYDPRCRDDAVVDGYRLQTHRVNATQLWVYNYIVGPLTFVFDIALPAPPTAVRLTTALIGGNGGDPARRDPSTSDENFIIQFP